MDKDENNAIQADISNQALTFSDSEIPSRSELVKVDGVAYSGGEVRQIYGSVVVNIDGMEFAPQVPLMLSHWNSTNARLGIVTPAKDGRQVTITGGMDTDSDQGRELAAKGRKYDWQLSIGADVIKSHKLQAGDTEVINGRTFTGPLYVADKSLLREVSVVALGADPNTHMKIVASLIAMNNEFAPDETGRQRIEQANKQGVQNMAEKKEQVSLASAVDNPPAPTAEEIKAMVKAEADKAIEAARNAENTRIADVKAAAAEYPEVMEKAIALGWTKEYTENIVAALKDVASKNAPATGNIIVKNAPDCSAKVLEAAMCLQSGIDEKVIEASCGKEALDVAGNSLSGLTLGRMVEIIAHRNGYTGIGTSTDSIRAALSSAELSGILSNVANKRAMKAFSSQSSIAERLCSVGNLNDFKENQRYRLSNFGNLEVVADGGEIKSGSLGEEMAVNKLDTYGQTFTLSRKMIYNDDLNEFLKIPTNMGLRAKQKIDQVFFTRLLANPTQGDNKALFCAQHKNYKAGATTALGVESLEQAITMFLDQTDAAGQPISVTPKFLLVPTALDLTARRLTTSALLMGATGETPAQNVIANYGLNVISSPYLNNAQYTNHSAKGYYLFADPNMVDTFEIGYLRGKTAPTVEQGEVDFNNLGISFRVYFDFGIREQDYRGMVFIKGEAAS